MPKVTIIGAGIAGLSAALRLAERGYEVTVFERDNFIGGKFRATEWEGRTTTRSVFHEHSYHMFLNWYHNFWEIASEIGAIKNFTALKRVKFLRKGDFPRMKELVNFGSMLTIPQNLFSGVLPIPDMFLYMYSVLDLLGTPMRQDRYRDLISVNAFASTKPYSTDRSIGMYDEYLAKTFGVASFISSAKSFQTFLEYGTYCPEPLYWAIKGDCFSKFLAPLKSKLESLGVRFVFNHQAESMTLDSDGNISNVTFEIVDNRFSPSLSERSWKEVLDAGGFPAFVRREPESVKIEGSLILAIPHLALSNLLNPDILNRCPELGESAKLQSVPMASVHLHLNDKFAKRLNSTGARLPREPVVLLNSQYKLSFVANSSLWPELHETYLNIVASDSRPLGQLQAPEMFTADRDWGRKGSGLSIESPVTTLDHILHEFRQFLHFENDEIDVELLQIDRNAGRELFINDVGSWKWRPEARTTLKNLFLAGDFCKNSIDVVCLEGAVVSGLQAAECVRRQFGVGAPIKIERPKKYPYPFFWPLKIMLAPYTVSAKLWSACNDLMRAMDDR